MKINFFFLLTLGMCLLKRMVMETCWWLWMCLLRILGELYAKYQYVILCELLFKKKCIWLYLQLLTSRTVLQAFWESTSGVIILTLAQIKFAFIFSLLLLLFSCPVISNSFVTPWIGNIQARILDWVCHFLSPGDFPNPDIKPTSPACISCIAGGLFTAEPLRNLIINGIVVDKYHLLRNKSVKDENMSEKNQMNMLHWRSLKNSSAKVKQGVVYRKVVWMKTENLGIISLQLDLKPLEWWGSPGWRVKKEIRP